MRVCLGGTFEPFHAGHRALLSAALDGASEVFVGVTDGALARRPDRDVSPWQQRARVVEEFVRASKYMGSLTVRALIDGVGPAATGAYDSIVVSPETVATARAINDQRQKAGLPALAVRVVPHVLAQDLLPISATSIHAGRIDADGRRLRPIHVAVGSGNPVKVQAVLEEFVRIVPVATDVRGFAAKTGVPEQPRGAQTLQGARTRARDALAAWPDADYAIGIEAGLMRFTGEEAHVEAQACAVIDCNGWETHGWGPAFHYPPWVTERALRGEMVSDILGPVAGNDKIGSTTGAIGYLSENRLQRTGLTQVAVFMAFLPRFRRDLYLRQP